VFCALAWMGVALVEKRKASITTGAGCDIAGQSLDDFGDQRGPEWVCDPGGLESAPSGTAGVARVRIGKDCSTS
jgi:hypothetical protein